MRIHIKIGRKEKKLVVRRNGTSLDTMVSWATHLVRKAIENYPEGFK